MDEQNKNKSIITQFNKFNTFMNMGIYHLSDEEVKRIKAKHARKEEEREYVNYLALKRKVRRKRESKR